MSDNELECRKICFTLIVLYLYALFYFAYMKKENKP